MCVYVSYILEGSLFEDKDRILCIILKLYHESRLWKYELYWPGSELCPRAGLSIGGVEPMGSITWELITDTVNLCTLRPVSHAPFQVEMRNKSDLKYYVLFMKYATLLGYLCKFSTAGKTEAQKPQEASLLTRIREEPGSNLRWVTDNSDWGTCTSSSYTIFTPKCRELLAMQKSVPSPG